MAGERRVSPCPNRVGVLGPMRVRDLRVLALLSAEPAPNLVVVTPSGNLIGVSHLLLVVGFRFGNGPLVLLPKRGVKVL